MDLQYDQIIVEAEKFALRYYRVEMEKNGIEDEGIWEDHIWLTRYYAKKLAEIEKADGQVVEIVAILHDIGKCEGKENHDIRSYEYAKTFVERLPHNDEKKNLILKYILKHSSKSSQESEKLQVEVMQSADVLAALFDWIWQEKGIEQLTEKEYFEVLDKSFEKLKLKSAIDMALQQMQVLKSRKEQMEKLAQIMMNILRK